MIDEVKREALELAARLNKNWAGPKEIVETAKQFEDYLRSFPSRPK